MKKKLKDLNLENEYHIVSRATSYEEQGNDIYPPAKRKLTEEDIAIATAKNWTIA